MARWWTPAHDEAAKHLAKKIKDAPNAAARNTAWAEYNRLHGVSFFLTRFDANALIVGEPITLWTDADAPLCLQASGQGDPAAETADTPIRSWSWDAATRNWTPQ